MKLTQLALLFILLSSSLVTGQRIVSASCGKCGRSVPSDSRTGDRCPYCFVRWGSETNTQIQDTQSTQELSSSNEQYPSFGVPPGTNALRNIHAMIKKAETMLFYDNNGISKAGIIHRGDSYSVNSIRDNFVNIRDPDTHQLVGWVHISDIIIYGEGIETTPEKDKEIYDAISDGAYRAATSSTVKDPFASIYQYTDRSENVTSDPTVAGEILEAPDTISGNRNKQSEQPKFNGMNDEQAAKYIQSESKKQGSKIFWNSFIRNILIAVIIGCIILTFNLNKASK